MPFDPSSAQPVGFDPGSAVPIPPPQGQAQAGMGLGGVNWTDIAKSGGTGLREGVEGLMTTAGFLDPVNYFNAARTGTMPANYGQMFDKSLQSKVGNLNYTPQTTAGRYARTIGQFAPAAIGGPEGLIPKAVETVVPAVASEYLGEHFQGTPLEDPARIAGAVVSPGTIGSLGRVVPALGRVMGVAPKAVAPAAVSAEHLNNLADEAFDRAFAGGRGAPIPQADALDLGRNLEINLTNEGFTPGSAIAPNTSAGLDFIQRKAQAGTLTLKDLHLARQLANRGAVAGSNDARFAGQFKSDLDDFMENNVPGGQDLTDAIGYSRAAHKTQIIEDQMNAAQAQANQGTGDYATNLSKKFGQLAGNKRLMRNFNDDETDAINNVSQGGLVHGAANWIGQKVSSFPGKAIAAGAGAIGGAFSPAGPILGPILGGSQGWNIAEKLGGSLKRFGAGAGERATAAQALVGGGPAAQAQYQAARNLRLANMLQRYGPPVIAGASTIQEPQ